MVTAVEEGALSEAGQHVIMNLVQDGPAHSTETEVSSSISTKGSSSAPSAGCVFTTFRAYFGLPLVCSSFPDPLTRSRSACSAWNRAFVTQ